MTELTVPVSKDIPVKYLLADMDVRYWEDAKVNGVEDDNDNPKMPLKSGDAWIIRVDLETGQIADWPQGTTAETHYKICDAGIYSVLDAQMNEVAKIDGYVPSMLSPKDSGYGDYAIMDIDQNGFIQNFKADLSCFDPEEQ